MSARTIRSARRVVLLAGVLAALAWGTAAGAQVVCDTTWDGSDGNGDWHDADNWTPAGQPGAGDHACVPNRGVSETIAVTQHRTIDQLTITGGAGAARVEIRSITLVVENNDSGGATVGVENGGQVALTSTSGTSSAELQVSTGEVHNTGTLELLEGTGGQRRLVSDLGNDGTVNITSDETVFSVTHPTGTYTNRGAFTVASGGALVIAPGIQSGPAHRFTQAGGTLTNNGSFVVTNFNGTTPLLAVTGGQIAGANPPVVERSRLEFTGAATGPGAPSGTIRTRQGTALAGDVPAGITVLADSGTTNAVASYTNRGTIRIERSTGSGTVTLDAPDGVLLTNLGTLELSGTGGSGDAAVLRSNLDNAPGGTVTITAATARFSRSPGSFTNRGAFTVATGAAFEVIENGGRFTQAGGTLTIDGSFRVDRPQPQSTNPRFAVTGGTIAGANLPVVVNGRIEFTGADAPTGTIRSQGGLGEMTGDVPAGITLLIDNGTTTTAASSTNRGTIRIQRSTGSGEVALRGPDGATLTNAGTIHLTGTGDSSDAAALRSNLDNSPTGTVRVDAAVARFSRNGSPSGTYTNRGTFTVASGAALGIAPGIQSGTVERFAQEDGTLTVDGSFTVSNFNGATPTLAVTGGRITGASPPVAERASLDFNGAAAPTGTIRSRQGTALVGDVPVGITVVGDSGATTAPASFTNHGTIRMQRSTGSGEVRFETASGATVTNAGTFESTGTGGGGDYVVVRSNLLNGSGGTVTISSAETLFDRSAASYVNRGAFTVTQGAALRIGGGGSLTVSPDGLLQVDGTLRLEGSARLSNYAANRLGGFGTYDIGGVFEFPGADIQTLAAAALTLDGPGAIVRATGGPSALRNLTTVGAPAELRLVDGSVVTTAATLTNRGRLAVETGSRLNTAGFTQASSGTLAVDGGAATAVAASGITSLDGRLEVAAVAPQPGAETTVVDGASRNGVFDVADLPQLGGGLSAEVRYTDADVIVAVGTDTLRAPTLVPAEGSRRGRVSTTITGTGFTRDTTARLVRAGQPPILPTDLQWRSSTRVEATFDLTGRPQGAWDLEVARGAETAGRPGAFTITDGRIGEVEVFLAVPDALRPGVTGEAAITYRNIGQTDITAPLLVLSARNALLQAPAGGALDRQRVILLGVSPSGDAGVLRPGATGRLTVPFRGIAGGTADFTVDVILESEITPVGDVLDAPLPSGVDPAAWGVVADAVAARLGTTFGGVDRAMAAAATTLSRHGERVTDVERLLAWVVEDARSVRRIEQVRSMDVAAPASSLPLIFARAWRQPITDRYVAGPLGRGWTHVWQLSLDLSGLPGAIRYRSPDGALDHAARGSDTWVADLGGGITSTVRRVGATFVVEEPDRTYVFSATSGRLTAVTDRHGGGVALSYAGADLTAITDPATGRAITLTYANGRIATVTDPAGEVHGYRYDTSGEHLLGVNGPRGETTYTYDTGADPARRHALLSATEPGGPARTFTYDAQGRPASEERGGTERVIFGYPALGRRTVTDATGAVNAVQFDDFGHAVEVTGPDGAVTTLDYDDRGLVTRTVDALGGATVYGYDDDANLTSVIDPLGLRTTSTHDDDGRVTSTTDAAGRTTAITYDATGERTATRFPDGTAELFARDGLGRLAAFTDRAGATTRYTYDGVGLLTGIDSPDGTTSTFTYDQRALPTSGTSPAGTTTYAYDDAGRLTAVSYPHGLGLTYAYGASQVTRTVTDGGVAGAATTFRYDAAGRPLSADGPSGTSLDHTYDAAGRPVRRDLGNGAAVITSYDDARRVAGVQHIAPGGAVLASYDLDRDALGRIVTRAGPDGTWTYGYDAADRLVRAGRPNGSAITYDLDAVGNRTAVTDGGTTTAYTVNAADQYTTVGSETFTYDGRGAVIARSGGASALSYDYDADGLLAGVTTDGVATTYTRDAFGATIAEQTAGTELRLLPEQDGALVAEGDTGGVTAHYLDTGSPVARVDAAGTSYLLPEPLGGTGALLDGAGAVRNRYDYGPFGEVVTATETVPNAYTTLGTFGVRDGRVGPRHYDPALGRFLSPDPLGAPGANLYTYADADPVNRMDIDGLQSEPKSAYEIATDPGTLSGVADTLFEAVDQQVGRRLFDAGSDLIDAGRRANFGEFVNGLTNTGKGRGLIDRGAAIQRGAVKLGVGAESLGHYAKGLGLGLDLIEIYGATTAFGETADRYGRGEADKYDVLHDGGIAAGKAVFTGLRVPFGTTIIDIWDSGTFFVADSFFQSRLYQPADPFGPAARNRPPRIPGQTRIVTSRDPNDITGPAGVGDPRWVAAEQPLGYAIRFENAADAGAPALVVDVTTTLDDDTDLTTFELATVAFGPVEVTVPAGEQHHHELVDAIAETGWLVAVDADLDEATREVRWTLTTIDPVTGLVPTGPTDGFLPPEDGSGRGQGRLTYRVQPSATAPSGRVVDAVASIVFDDNPAIVTNTHTNTLDRDRPTSAVAGLPDQTVGTAIDLRWSGSDPSSGIGGYDVYVREDGGPFDVWLASTTATQASYTGTIGRTYDFFVRAEDAVGLQQLREPAADATTTLVAQPPTPTPSPSPTPSPAPTSGPPPTPGPEPSPGPTPRPTANPTPSPTPPAVPQVRRLAGPDRIATAVAVSQAAFPDGAPAVVLARADVYADALAGAPLAATLDAPILLTAPDAMPAATADELRRLAPGRVVVLGGTAAVGEVVEAAVRAAGIAALDRVAGGDRFDTAALIAARLPAGADAYVVEGADADPVRGWPDALSVSPLAAFQQRPILPVTTEDVPPATLRALDELGVERATVIGGTAAVSEAVQQALTTQGLAVERVAGASRYDTSRAVADRAVTAGMDPASTWLATGLSFPDALVAGPAVAADGGVLLLADGRDLAASPPTLEWLTQRQVPRVTLLGGTAALSEQVEASVRAAIGAPGELGAAPGPPVTATRRGGR